MSHSIRSWFKTQKYCVQIPAESDVCHRGCAYTVLKTGQWPGVCGVVYGTVYYKEPLKSFDKNRTSSADFGPPSVAVLP